MHFDFEGNMNFFKALAHNIYNEITNKFEETANVYLFKYQGNYYGLENKMILHSEKAL